MTAKMLSASPLVEKIKNDLKSRCEMIKKSGTTPSMSVVLVGDNPASLSYIKNKKKMCEEVGAQFNLLQLHLDISHTEFLDLIKKLNLDPKVHGIIIQLPVSEQLKKLNLSNLVLPSKDIDGFHGLNTQNIYTGSTDLKLLMPCTPKGIINLLKFYNIPIEGKHAVVIGRSLIVGKPLSMLLSNFNATVTLAHSLSKNLVELTQSADILISAVGKTHYIKASHINPARLTTVVDVGMNTLNNKLTGDVDPEVAKVASALSPVPGGVGPITVISLIENLITATENQFKG